MKVLEGMGSTRRWVSHKSKRGPPRRLEGTVHGYTELKSEAGSRRDADLGRCMTKSEQREMISVGPVWVRQDWQTQGEAEKKENEETGCTKLDHKVTCHRKLFWLCISLYLLYNSMPTCHIGKS